MFFKVAACAVASSLFLITGCGATPAVERATAVPAQVPPRLTPAPTVQVKLVAETVHPDPPTVVPLPLPTPVVRPMPIPVPDGPPYTYHIVAAGESLSYIAMLYDTSIEDLVRMNKLDGPEAMLQIDQSLRVPVHLETLSPAEILLPDSEVVYGPSYVGFDIADFVNSQKGYLATYSEVVDGERLSGADIIEQIAIQFSVGPRLLLALLEHYGGWVTNPAPAEKALNQPLGPRNPRGGSLYRALGFTANRINAGYYGYKRDGFWIFRLADGSQAITPQGLNAGTVGLQNILAIHSNRDTWAAELKPAGFIAVYRRLFGDPASHAFEPVVPITLTQPPLALPWAKGQGFYFAGGPHPAYADGSAWAAVDFAPPDVLGNCFYSDEPSLAAAAGVIVFVRQGEVHLDLDGDGYLQTGWVLQYLHMALDVDHPVQVGQRVKPGDVIGYASCEGGLAESSHLHLSRRYNGEWIEAGGPVPLNLAGWVVQPNLAPYDGSIKKGTEVRQSCECWDANLNLIVNTETN